MIDKLEHSQWIAYSATQAMINELRCIRIAKLENAARYSRIPETDNILLRLLLNEAYVYEEIIKFLTDGNK